MREMPTSHYVPCMPGDVVSLRTFATSMRNLQHPFSENPEPYPTQEFLRQAWKEVSQAYGKRAILRTPESKLEGILKPVFCGVDFLYYLGNQPAVHLYSPEDLELQKTAPWYEFLTERIAGSSPLYGLESLEARFRLWKAGVKPKK